MHRIGMITLGVVLVLNVSIQSVCAESVTVERSQLTIGTYPWQDDINPKFWALEIINRGSYDEIQNVYPYTMQDHLFRRKEDRTHETAVLENEYVRIVCLPKFGGRLHEVRDKTTGEPIFYHNHVIKPSMIALRGAWVCGGVEWNAGPQGHTITDMSPVSVWTGTNEKGGAYLEISNLEQSLRTRWTVRLTLWPGKTYLDEEISVENPIDAFNPFYFWNNTAFPKRPGARFIVPTTLGVDHFGRDFESWPIREGRDLSWLKNHVRSFSTFAYLCEHDFFGAYDVDRDFGVVQTADHIQLGGKKIFTWGNWEEGLFSQLALTDEDGEYIEVQSGPLSTQTDYEMLTPHAMINWREAWYPVHGLGQGFDFATQQLALSAQPTDTGFEIKLIPTAVYKAAQCLVIQDGRHVLETTVDLSPRQCHTLTLDADPKQQIHITVTHKGKELARCDYPLNIIERTPPKQDRFWETKDVSQFNLDEKYRNGLRLDRATDRSGARKFYEMALEEDPGYLPALRQLAVLDFEAGLYNSAIDRLEKALHRLPNDDGMSWYFLGAAYLRLHQPDKALDTVLITRRCFGTTALANDLAGRAYMQLNQTDRAIEAFQQAVLADGRDAVARQHLCLARYAAGQKKQAFKAARQRLKRRPSDLVMRSLLALQNKKTLSSFVRDVRLAVGDVDFEMIDVALTFADMQLFNEAVRLLEATCIDSMEANEVNPLSLYYLAWLSHRAGDDQAAHDWLARAAKTYRDGVFPSRPQTIPVLEYALDHNSGDAYAHLHLGNLCTHLGQLDRSLAHWHTAAHLDSSLSVAFRNLALYATAIQNDYDRAAGYYRRAIAARPNDQTLYRDLADVLIQDNQPQEAIEVLESTPWTHRRRDDLTTTLARTYINESLYADAINTLNNQSLFVNWEGSRVVWQLFNRAHVEHGKVFFENKDYPAALDDFNTAMTYPANLGIGRPDKLEHAEALYWKGRVLLAMDKTQQARDAWRQGEELDETTPNQNEYRRKCQQALDDLSDNP